MCFEGEKELLAEDQRNLARRIVESRGIGVAEVHTVGGCSQISLAGGLVASTVVSLRLGGLGPIGASFAVVRTDFDYLPTYLVYREGSPLLKALDSLGSMPDVLLVPGVGIHHPRAMGMARHLGYLLSLPTIGISRRPLGTIHPEDGLALAAPPPFKPSPERGTIYVSPGWGIDQASSEELVRLCMGDHRLPEPIHLAKTICRQRSREIGRIIAPDPERPV